jgi:hypothetical protein
MISNAAIHWTQVVRDIITVGLPCTLVYKPCGTADAFCLDRSICQRRHGVFREDKWWIVYCYAEAEHAEKSRMRFGGERFNPKDRGGGSNWAR